MRTRYIQNGILNILSDNKLHTLREISEKLEGSSKTIYRTTERRVRIIGRFYRRRDYGRRIKRYNRDFGELSEKFYYNLDNKIKENIVTKGENMKTFKEVRDDLRNIRFYYANYDKFQRAFEHIGQNSVIDTVNEYNVAIKRAPPKLFGLYVSLYTKNNTQAATANEMNFSESYIQKQNDKLIGFLYDYFRNK